MSKEGLSLQYNMFSGELVDTRSDAQKKRDKERDIPQQIQMFKTPEMVQFGGKTNSAYRDWLDKTSARPLVLQTVETRTTEEIEQDLMHEAEKLMSPLFANDLPSIVEAASPASETEAQTPFQEPPKPQEPTIIFDAKQNHCQRGLRARLRAQNVPVRRRF